MSGTTRRGFLKGVGTTLSAIGITAANIPPLIEASAAADGAAAAEALPGVQPARPTWGRGERGAIGQDDLEMLVAEQLAWWVGERQTFTAYDITRALRATYPAVDIFHEQVRDAVHARMRPAITAQAYRRALVRFPAGSAWRYWPLL